ncbi:MAG: hypothetical protein ACRCX2_12070 [Paraclostridium sp.]
MEQQPIIPSAIWNSTYIDSQFGQYKQYVASDLSALQFVLDKLSQKELDMRLEALYSKAENIHRDKLLAEKDEQLKRVENQVQFLTDKLSTNISGSSIAPNYSASQQSADEAEMAVLEAHVKEHPYHAFHLEFYKKAKELGKKATVKTVDADTKRYTDKDTMEIVRALEADYGADIITKNLFNNDARLRSLMMQGC